jgi:phosphoglycerate kinase
MTALRTIERLEVRGKRVIVRIDADVDLGPDGTMEEGGDHRLKGCLQTLTWLRQRGARLILISHLGRPEGKIVERLRMAPIAKRLEGLLGAPIRPVPFITGPEARDAALALNDGEILFLENVRFDPREETNDSAFAQELAALGELYVNEAFGVSHRAHASLVAITDFRPSYAGMLLAKEVETLQKVFSNPQRPLVAVVSGAKLETKIGLLRSLLPRVDVLLTGGGIANMFLRVQGMNVGASLVEPNLDVEVKQLLQAFGAKIFVSTDVRVARGGKEEEPAVVPVTDVEGNDIIYDIGPLTVQRYCNAIGSVGTCIWNGPLGKVEHPSFQEGTKAFAACLQASDVYSVVGGGDTVTALTQMGVTTRFRHVSSGGGALIAFLEGAPLPGVDALRV